jgi:hypothetical protein
MHYNSTKKKKKEILSIKIYDKIMEITRYD